MKGKPHVSEALAHLRHGVTFCALMVCVAAVAQFLVFGFVHFTTIRWEEKVELVEDQPLSIVENTGGMTSLNPATPKVDPARKVPSAGATAVAPVEPTEPSRQLGAADPILRRVTEIAGMIGSSATVALGLLVMLGVAIAGGGAIPGVQKAVSAASWSIALAMACLPWKQLVPTTPFQGIFGPYDVLTAASAAVDHGGTLAGVLANYLVLPMAALLMSLLILARFRGGVADGIIVTSVNELDAALDREMSTISKRGVAITGGRAIGALNQAIGAATEPTHAMDSDDEAPRPAEPPRARPRRLNTSEMEGFKRPI